MFDAAHTGLLSAREVARTIPLATAANGLHYASFGYTEVPADSLKQIVEAVPAGVALPLDQHAYYFVPLALGETEETEIAAGFTLDLGDRATCHRNVLLDGVPCTFISARLMQDRFALAFEFFINLGHQLVDAAGVPPRFCELAWAQARADVRGETSLDAYQARKRATDASENGSATRLPSNFEPVPSFVAARLAAASAAAHTSSDPSGSTLSPHPASTPLSDPAPHPAPDPISGPISDPPACSSAQQLARKAFFEAAFADTVAIYLLSLLMDLDYADLREREYPLLAAPALADRLRLAAELFPPQPGYEFSIRYRRRR